MTKEAIHMLIAVDTGNAAIKSMNTTFPTGLTTSSVCPSFADDVIKYNNEYYVLVDDRNIPYKYDKTQDDTFFVLSLFAIAKELRLSNMTGHVIIDLAVGLPLEHYEALKQKTLDYYNRGHVSFVYNNEVFNIQINRILVKPQALSAVVVEAQELLRLPTVFIVDIGGYTTDIALLRNGKISMEYCRSLDMGTIALGNSIAAKANSLYNIAVRNDHIQAVLQRRDSLLPESVKDIIHKEVANYAKSTVDKLRELQIDLRTDPVVFLGGGALMLKPHLDSDPRIAQARFITDPKANAIGYYTLGARELTRQSV